MKLSLLSGMDRAKLLAFRYKLLSVSFLMNKKFRGLKIKVDWINLF